MVCKVCKRELTSPVCSFCGEDNSVYAAAGDEEVITDTPENEAVVFEENAPYTDTEQAVQEEVKIKKYKINYKKLFSLIGVAVLIVLAVIIVINWLTPSEKANLSDEGALFSSEMLCVCQGDEWGYISSQDTTKFAIDPQFRFASDFMDDVAFVMIDGKYAMINKEGQLLTIPLYSSFTQISENGYIAVMEDDKWGYIKKDAQYVINPKFSSASRFFDGMAVVSVNGSYGYIGEDGEYTIAPQYDMALSFSSDDKLAAIKVDGKWGYINTEGTAVIDPRFDKAFPFKNGRAVVMLYGDYGIIDTNGEFVTEPVFDEYFEFEKDGSATIKIGSRYGYINADGEYSIIPQFVDMGSFGEQNLTFAARGDGKYGFIDKEGKFVIEPQFEDAGEFANGMAPVKADGLWGYINEEGKYVIDPRFSVASSFYSDGYAITEDALGKTVVIDAAGNNVLNSEVNLSDAICN